MQYLKYQLYNILAILLEQFEKTPISLISQEPMAGKKKDWIFTFSTSVIFSTLLFSSSESWTWNSSKPFRSSIDFGTITSFSFQFRAITAEARELTVEARDRACLMTWLGEQKPLFSCTGQFWITVETINSNQFFWLEQIFAKFG